MKNLIVGLIAAVVLAAPSAFATKMICKDTGREVKGACCCDVKDGKFVCRFDKKVREKCCCVAVK